MNKQIEINTEQDKLIRDLWELIARTPASRWWPKEFQALQKRVYQVIKLEIPASDRIRPGQLMDYYQERDVE